MIAFYGIFINFGKCHRIFLPWMRLHRMYTKSTHRKSLARSGQCSGPFPLRFSLDAIDQPDGFCSRPNQNFLCGFVGVQNQEMVLREPMDPYSQSLFRQNLFLYQRPDQLRDMRLFELDRPTNNSPIDGIPKRSAAITALPNPARRASLDLLQEQNGEDEVAHLCRALDLISIHRPIEAARPFASWPDAARTGYARGRGLLLWEEFSLMLAPPAAIGLARATAFSRSAT